MPITLDGVALQNATAPLIFQTCRMPIVDLRRYRRPDEVVQNMRTFIGGWGPNTIAPAIASQVIDEDTVTNSGDDCRFPVVSVALTGCDWVAPNQKVLGVESEDINWLNLVTRFCTVNNITTERLGQVFNADGTLNGGNPYSLQFVRFVMNLLNEALALRFTHSALLGDEANVNQFDGLYTQIDNGWAAGDNACEDTLNVGQGVNWDLLTGGDGTGVASPDEVTVATTITLWGEDFDVPAGWTLGKFLAEYARAAEANYGRGFEVEWEMHAHSGARMGLLEALSCIQFCGYDTVMSDALIARYEDLVNGQIARIWPDGITFPIFETYHVPDGTLRFGPRNIGALPTYGLVFENIAEVIRMLNPLGQALYGSGAGLLPTGGDEPLMGMTREKLMNRFEASTIHWDLLKTTAKCVRASVMTKAGVLATDRHLWLKVTNIGTTTLRLAPPDDWTVDDEPMNNEPPAVPSLTLLADGATTSDTTPTFTWGAVDGALSYTIQISNDEAFTDVEVTASVTAATYTPSALALGEYYWRVRSVDLDGMSAWSVVRSFEITA